VNCFLDFSQDIDRYQTVNRSAIGQRRKLSIIIALIGDPKARKPFSLTISLLGNMSRLLRAVVNS